MKVENKVLPNEDQINGFLKNPEIGPISMVNLLKYKKTARYEDGRDTNLTGEEAYQLYAAEVVSFVKKYGGEYLARGGEYTVVEGEDNYPRIILIKFPSYEKALEWYHSEDYKPIKDIRLKVVDPIT